MKEFAQKGADCSLDEDVGRLLREMHAAGKPIGAICIAPAIVALVLGSEGPRMTLGGLDGAAAEAAKTGAKMVACPVDEIVVDEEQNLVSTPAYILARNIGEADAGIGKLVAEVLRRAGG